LVEVDKKEEVQFWDGVVYLLIIKENKPQEVIDNMMKKGFKACHKVMERKCKNECLMVLRFSKHIIKHSWIEYF